MVVETLPQARGMFDDRWRRWIVDFGFPDPDRGKGGRLLSRRATMAPLAESGHSRTTRAFLLGRAFMEDDGLRRRADHR